MQSKKRKASSSPSITVPSNPSVILRALYSSLPPEHFAKILENAVYPVLDALEIDYRAALFDELTEIKTDTDNVLQKLQEIRYEEHEHSLKRNLAAIEAENDLSWEDGVRLHEHLVLEIIDVVNDWLPKLWLIAVEESLGFLLIRKCLGLCISVMYGAGAHSRAQVIELNDSTVTFKDSDGDTVYIAETHLRDTVLWVLKEFIVAAAARGDPYKAIEEDLKQFDLLDDVLDLIRPRTGGENDDDNDKFHDAHWTRAMLNAGDRLLTSRHEGHLSAFTREPSLDLYNCIMARSPGLVPALLNVTRSWIFSDRSLPPMHYRTAADIFCAADEIHDLLQLVNTLPRPVSDFSTIETECAIINYLCEHKSEAGRTKGHTLLENALQRSKSNVISLIEREFVGFEQSCEFLKTMLERHRLTPQPVVNVPREVRWTVLKQFAHIARGRSGYRRNDSDYEDSDMDDAADNDDSWKYLLQRTIHAFISILKDLPDREEAERIWDEVKPDMDENLLFSVEGAAEALAAHYARATSTKLYIADGIRTWYRVFSCSNVAELADYMTQIEGQEDMVSSPQESSD